MEPQATGAVVGFTLFACTFGVMCLIIPEWLRERRRNAVLTERVEQLRRQYNGAQAMLDTSRQQLLRCREQVIARNLDDLGKRDAQG